MSRRRGPDAVSETSTARSRPTCCNSRRPDFIELTPTVVWDLIYFTIAIVFVSGVESLLCSRMADRLADNRGIPFNPNKELWGQGWVQILVPLVNGFPHTGALARTATNIKVGAVSPLAGIFKFALKLLLAIFLAQWLEMVPMACIGGILMFVAVNMVKPAEVREVWNHNRFHAGLMVYTAVMVAVTDFLIGVLSALVIYGVLYRFLDASPVTKPHLADEPAEDAVPQSADNTRGATSQAKTGVMTAFDRPLVALSLTDADQSLLDYAAMLARSLDWDDILFAHVAANDPQPWLQRLGDEVRRVFGEPAPSTRHAFHAVPGARLDQILGLAVEHRRDLIVLGHRRARSGRRRSLDGWPWSPQPAFGSSPRVRRRKSTNILVPIDFSDHSADALAVAANIARSCGLRTIRAVHVFFDPSTIRYDEHVERDSRPGRSRLRAIHRTDRSPGRRSRAGVHRGHSHRARHSQSGRSQRYRSYRDEHPRPQPGRRCASGQRHFRQPCRTPRLPFWP